MGAETEIADREEEQPETDEKRQEELNKLFKDFKTEIEKRQVLSSDNLDKSILTYSSWGLGISIAFLKDFVPITVANNASFLYWSWYLFSAAIALTTLSFLISYKGLDLSLRHAQEYYLKDNENFIDKKNYYNIIVLKSNIVCVILFLLALVFTIVFVSSNLEKSAIIKENEKMSKIDKVTKTTHGTAMDGLPVSLMQAKPPKSTPKTQANPGAAGTPPAPKASQNNKPQQ